MRETLALERDPFDQREQQRIAAKIEAAKRVTFKQTAEQHINVTVMELERAA